MQLDQAIHGLLPLQLRPLRQLEHEVQRVEPGGGTGLRHVGHQVRMSQAALADVDTHRQPGCDRVAELPLPPIGTRLIEHPALQWHDQSGFVGQWDEVGR